MSNIVEDIIEKEITIHAPVEQVYQAITDPEKITAWFPSAIEGNLAVGESPILDFGEHGKNQIYIVDSKPNQYFAYRWVPGSRHFIGDVLSVPNTLVEFFIAEDAAGTKVTVKESGFASLPADIMEGTFKDNSHGWEFMMGRLNKIFATD